MGLQGGWFVAIESTAERCHHRYYSLRKLRMELPVLKITLRNLEEARGRPDFGGILTIDHSEVGEPCRGLSRTCQFKGDALDRRGFLFSSLLSLAFTSLFLPLRTGLSPPQMEPGVSQCVGVPSFEEAGEGSQDFRRCSVRFEEGFPH